jgi:hypothetical protein
MTGGSTSRSRRDPEVTVILAELPRTLAPIGRELRKVVAAVAPKLEECVKWNAPNWRGRELVLCLMVYPDHLNLGVWRGAELAASFPMIEGTGKSLRHIKVQSVVQARSPEVRKVILAAVALDAQGR